jgi:iron complex transport system ATP-binding protein
MALLSLEEVRFAYGEREILRGVSLDLEAGEAVALVGPNGAGKTTLLRVASGMLEPTSGRVLLDGRPLADVPRRLAARRVAGVAAREEADFPFTVRETVALGLHPWRSAFAPIGAAEEERIERALADVGLLELADRVLPGLSTGERQRAAIARSLVQHAEVLLLDEPTAHLDLGHRLRMLRLVKEGGRAVLAVLHDLNLAAMAADRVVLLVAGEVLAEGTPAEVLTPDLVRRAFGARVEILRHPEKGVPVVVPLEEAP